MGLKETLLRWLGVEQLIADAVEVEARKRVYLEGLLRETNSKYTALKTGLDLNKTEMETHLNLVMNVTMSAAKEMAKLYSQQGDALLKEYVDDCLGGFEQVTLPQNMN